MATEAAQKAAILAVLPGVTFAPTVFSYHSSIAAGQVISQSAEPPPNNAGVILPDAVITLTVSLGAAPTSESRWIGLQDPISGIPVAETAVANAAAMVVVFVLLDIPGDPLRLHSGGVTLTWGGFDWLGLSKFGSIDAVSESLEVLAQPVNLTLSGVDPVHVADAMSTPYHGADIFVYIGVMNVDTYQLIDTPELVWEGFIDVMYIDIDKNSAVIRVDCEHRLRRQPVTSRYTDEDQRSRFPTDRFFDKLHLIDGYVGKWGARDTSFGGGSMGGRGQGRGHSQEK